MRTSWTNVLGWTALGVAVLLAGCNVWLGELNQDEGWYLYAAGRVREGYLPYRDFAFTQSPVFLWVYAAAHPLVETWGVAGGRVFTALLGLLSALAAAALAARLAPAAWGKTCFLAGFILAAVNVYQSYFTTVVKTYALAALWLATGLLALSHAEGRRGKTAACVSGILLALGAGTRLSAGAALPVVFLFLVWRDGIRRPRLWLPFALGGAATLALWSLPFLLLAPEGFLFGLLRYHALRDAGGAMQQLMFKAGFLSRFAQAYYLMLCLTAALALHAWSAARDRAPSPGIRRPVCPPALLWAIVIAITLVHVSAPFPYDDYQAILAPLAAAAVACGLARALRTWGHTPARRDALAACLLFCSCAAAFSSPINQQWVVRERDRIWWRMKERSDLAVLRKAGAWVRRHSEPGDLLLTQDLYLAVEARRRVPAGMELGPFSLYPDWSRERAERLRVLNTDMLRERIADAGAPVAALSGYGFAISSPTIQELPADITETLRRELAATYRHATSIASFGQAHTRLDLFLLRAGREEEGE